MENTSCEECGIPHISALPFETVDFFNIQHQVNNPITSIDHLTLLNDTASQHLPQEVKAYLSWLEARLRSAIYEEEHAPAYF